MIRLREIDDHALREKLREALARRRGMLPEEIPDWWELDDLDVTDLLNEIDEADRADEPDDPRM